MGRRNVPPPSGGNGKVGKKKQDTGLPAFFKHRKQQQQGASASPNNKGKGRLQQPVTGSSVLSSSAQIADSLRTASTEAAANGIVDSAEGSSSSSTFSPYEHLNQGAFHGGTKDSSVKAYGRHLRSLIEQSDVLIQVLDARDPMGSRSITSENLLLSHPGKKLLLVLTKIDLVPKATLQAWLVHLRQFHPTLAFKSTSTLSASGRASRKLHTQTALTAAGGAITSLEASSSATLLQLLKNYARSQPKGMSLTVGIFGPPNVGKSSLINSLVRSRACSVAPRPGETKTLQTVLLDRKVRLIDSPGVAMPGSNIAMDTQTQEILRGTVKVELVEDPITPVAEILKRADPVKVTKLYGLPEIDVEEVEEEEVVQQKVDEPTPMQGTDNDSTEPQQTSRLPSKVDFNTMRGEGAAEDDDEMDDGDADSDEEDDFHRVDFQDPDDHADLDVPSVTPAVHSRRPRGPIGYDASDPMDFLLRLALTKGKMLKGGRPDVEGAARGVINDWNSGKIAWFVKPPLASTSVEARKLLRQQQQLQQGGSVEVDEQMTAQVPPKATDGSVAAASDTPRQEEAKTQEEPTVVSGFSQAFDLDGLFAQADAQMFGGSVGGKGQVQTPATESKAPPSAAVTLQAGDVSRSSLGKRGRPTADDESDDDAGKNSSDDSSDDDSDDEEGGAAVRMTMPAADATPAARGDDVMDVSGPSRRPQQGRPRGEDELATFLSSATGAAKPDSRIAAHLTAANDNAKSTSPPSTSSGPAKRGQRNKKKKNRTLDSHPADDVPSYIARQQHKATLPVNMKKNHILTDDTFDDVGVGRGTSAKKRGEARKKKRKLARREGREDGGVWRELEEVTLE